MTPLLCIALTSLFWIAVIWVMGGGKDWIIINKRNGRQR